MSEITRMDLGGVNCWLCSAGDGFILVDTGGHLTMDKEFSDRRAPLETKLGEAGCDPGNLRLIVLTHGDSDHCANAAYLREKYGAKIAMHAADTRLVTDPRLEEVLENFKFRSPVLNLAAFFMKDPIRKMTVKILDDFERFSPDLYLDESFDLSGFGLNARVIHMPGHTAGSIGIFTADGDLIAGDTFANIGKPSVAMNAVDFRILRASVKKLENLNIRTVYPGHGEPFAMKSFRV